MDEKQFKFTYDSVNPQRCVFEKAINSRICNCANAQRFNLADREGVACKSAQGLERCNHLLSFLHDNARFVLQRLDTSQPLGHADEIKIQNGGLLGLKFQLDAVVANKVTDIDALITDAVNEFNSLEAFPYSQIMKTVNTYKIRNRRNQSKSNKHK